MKAPRRSKNRRNARPKDTQRAHRPSMLYQDGKPVSVVIGLKQYERMLERLEDFEDLAYIEKLKREPPDFISLEDYLDRHK